MIQTMQSELFRIRKSRLFWACLVLAAFFVFALALTFYHNSVNGMLPVISLVSFTEFLFFRLQSDFSIDALFVPVLYRRFSYRHIQYHTF